MGQSPLSALGSGRRGVGPPEVRVHAHEFDAVGAGSGPNGLFAAVGLAQAGSRVLVLGVAPTGLGEPVARSAVLPRLQALGPDAFHRPDHGDHPAADPAYFLHGQHDRTVSYRLAKAYASSLDAPRVGFYMFTRSAHSPAFEEPDQTLKILTEDVLTGITTLAEPPPTVEPCEP